MNTSIQTQAIHHLTLTVTDLSRAVEFYTGLLGFQKAMDLSPSRVLLANGKSILALTEAPDPSQIKDLGPGLGIYVLAFRDPDNIQLELTAPYG
jgi:catechol-2,3-dioxygenase